MSTIFKIASLSVIIEKEKPTFFLYKVYKFSLWSTTALVENAFVFNNLYKKVHLVMSPTGLFLYVTKNGEVALLNMVKYNQEGCSQIKIKQPKTLWGAQVMKGVKIFWKTSQWLLSTLKCYRPSVCFNRVHKTDIHNGITNSKKDRRYTIDVSKANG